MAQCRKCNNPINTTDRFCASCGQDQLLNPAANSGAFPASMPKSAGSSSTKIIVGVILGFFGLLILAGGGITYFIFQHLKDSPANQLAIETLRQNPEAKQALGEIQKIGWPGGKLSTEGDSSGEASLSMSVRGSQGQGKYYATLHRENGVWHLQSGRLVLENGKTLQLTGSIPANNLPPEPSTPPRHPSSSDSGGKQLTADATAASSWRDMEWPGHGIRFRVPSDWTQSVLDKNEVQIRSPDRQSYFIAHLTYFDQKIPMDGLLNSMVDKSGKQLKRDEIAGYARKNIGPAQGFVEISSRSDGATMAVWTGYYDTAEFGTVSVSFLLGSGSLAEFDRVTPILGAILDSVKFP